jgi:hypothetical protein
MSGHCNINPALNTRWMTEKQGKIFRIQVLYVNSTGVGDRYQILSYGIQYDHKEGAQEIEADLFRHHIKMGVVRPDWNSIGSLIWE